MRKKDIQEETLFQEEELFPTWYPFGPVARLLRGIGLRDEETYLFEAPFKEFRHPVPDRPLVIPEDVRSSDDWFSLLWGNTSQVIEPEPGLKEYDSRSPGLQAQVNLDNIGRDFLCLIYYRQRILDLSRTAGLEVILRDILKEREDRPLEFTSLNNSLLNVEALSDWLTLEGIDLSLEPEERGRRLWVLLTDPPTRSLPLRDVPSPVGMFRDTANFSRFVRSLSSCLQDGGKWTDFKKLTPQDFNLPGTFSTLGDRRLRMSTSWFAQAVSMSREFCLWDIWRGNRLPSLREISSMKGIPHQFLINILNRCPRNDETNLQSYEGLSRLREGMTDRLIHYFVQDIESRSTNKQEGQKWN